MAKKYRKIPVVIEAEHVTPELIVANEGTTETYVTNDGRPRTIEWRSDGVYISTLEGVMKADVGDFIITGIQGEKYPCKPDIFEKTYEEVAE